MAQTKYAGNLSAASFPLSTTFKGQSVIIANRDQNSGPYRDFSGDTTQLGMNIPQLYYAENVIPTNEGYKSISYNPFIGAAPSDSGEFIQIMTVFDGQSNKALIGITSTYKLYILSTYTSGGWALLSPSTGTWSTGYATTGTVFGVVYINLQGLGVYTLNIPATTLTKTTITGVTDSDFLGICDSTSYLIGFNQTDVVWSSTEDPTDFTPSLVTGAGGGTPEGLKGQIILCKEIYRGFIVYTSVHMISAVYSGNLQYPWVFTIIPGGGGISSPFDVGESLNIATHDAWTSAGLLDINVQYAKQTFPFVTDFLAGGILESYSSETKQVTTEYTSVPFRVSLCEVGSRYMCISYGRAGTNVFSHYLIYDEQLKRWGKGAAAHTQIFEITADTSGDGLTWTESAPNEWQDYPVAWSSLVNWSNVTPKAKNTLGILAADGSISYVDFNYGNDSAPGVAIFGKYQLTRTSVCTLECIELETVSNDTNNFSVSVQTTINGLAVDSIVIPTRYTEEGDIRRYDTRVTGRNHSIIVEGAFSLASFILTLHNTGRR